MGCRKSPGSKHAIVALISLAFAIFVSPWGSIVPGVMIFITSMSFNMLSDGLRHAMDIKM